MRSGAYQRKIANHAGADSGLGRSMSDTKRSSGSTPAFPAVTEYRPLRLPFSPSFVIDPYDCKVPTSDETVSVVSRYKPPAARRYRV